MSRATQIEQQLNQRSKRQGILVPLLEDLFSEPVEPDSEEDIEFITDVFRRGISRGVSRQSDPVFSPSQLASCLRYVYLLKHHSEHGIPKQRLTRLQPNFYFFNGNWLHVKWQFALHKLNQKLPDEEFALIGCEVPIVSKHKDHGGTIDALVVIDGELFPVDFKGLNVRTFGEITRGYVPHEYLVQLADYGMLVNSSKVFREIIKDNLVKISRGLLITESKGGPDNKFPIALHETEVPVETYLPEVRFRLEALRENGAEKEIPEPECTSPYIFQFQGCPFRGFCKKEVTKIYKKRKKIEDREAADVQVARPSSATRKRRVAKGKSSSTNRV